MTIYFYLRYNTKFGQTFFISANIVSLDNIKTTEALPLTYLTEEFWFCKLDGKHAQKINYRYILREEGSVDILDADRDRIIDLKNHKATEIIVIDTWNSSGLAENTFYTKPFKQVLLPIQKNALFKSS